MGGSKLAIYVDRRKLVLPGELLAEGKFEAGPNTYKDGEKIYSSVVGLAEIKNKVVSVIALKGCYMPKVGDVVIGVIYDYTPTSWQVDINSPYLATLQVIDALPKPIDPAKENIRKYYDVGDVIVGEVIVFDKTRNPMLTTKGKGYGKLSGGRLLEISPTKVPRLIGRRGSMINMIKKELGCQIIVGQNGRVWVSAKNAKYEDIAIKVIRKIEMEAQVPGLTERVRKMIKEEKGRVDGG
ncbi:MAG: RNA-binding protein [Candidatus Methanomethylicota archaeon]|nr:MAG: RNA-binding protein [Candidatus Verstraetearchaeota archaeon]